MTVLPMLAGSIFFAFAMMYAGVKDVATLRIGNRLVLGLLAGFLVLAPLSGIELAGFTWSVGAATAVLVVGVGLFAFGWIGGGYAKLAAVAVLWLGAEHALDYNTASAAHTGTVSYKRLGFADTVGGRGGRVIKVTTLQPTGPGSFLEAVATSGPRIIVFEVGGVIDLGKRRIDIYEPYLTVAGQTAPSPGITFIRGNIVIRTHDVIIRHIRVRVGDAGIIKGTETFTRDCLSVTGPDAYNIIIDHNSLSWGTDECMSVSGGAATTAPYKVTLSNNIVAETLHNSVGTKQRHSRASLVNQFTTNISFARNLYAHNDRRHLLAASNSTGIFVNNIIYDPGTRISHVRESVKWSFVNNVTIFGPAADFNGTRWLPPYKLEAFVHAEIPEESGYPPPELYIVNNKYLAPANKYVYPLPSRKGYMKVLGKPLVWPRNFEKLSITDAYHWALSNAGARPSDRDVVDKRIIEEIKTQGAVNPDKSIIDSQEEVGGYPVAPATYRRLSPPSSPGQIEAWLAEFDAEVGAN